MSRSIGSAISPMNSHGSCATTGGDPSLGAVSSPIRPISASTRTLERMGSSASALRALRRATSHAPSPVAMDIESIAAKNRFFCTIARLPGDHTSPFLLKGRGCRASVSDLVSVRTSGGSAGIHSANEACFSASAFRSRANLSNFAVSNRSTSPGSLLNHAGAIATTLFSLTIESMPAGDRPGSRLIGTILPIASAADISSQQGSDSAYDRVSTAMTAFAFRRRLPT